MTVATAGQRLARANGMPVLGVRGGSPPRVTVATAGQRLARANGMPVLGVRGGSPPRVTVATAGRRLARANGMRGVWGVVPPTNTVSLSKGPGTPLGRLETRRIS